MPNNKKRGDNVASSRLGLGKTKQVQPNKLLGRQKQTEFIEMITKMFKSINAQIEVEPNVDILNNILNKKDKKKLN